MPTIADYLDDSYRDDFDDYEADVYYLHIPRAIVKRAEEEASAGRQVLDNIDDWDFWGLATDSVLPEVKDQNYKQLNRLPYYISNLAGNRNSGNTPTYIENQLGQNKIKNALIARKAWQSRGADIDSVVLGRMWHGDPTAKNIMNNIIQKAKDSNMSSDVISGLNDVSTQINDHTNVTPGSRFYGPRSAAKVMGRSLDSLVTDKEVEAYFKNLGLSDEQIQQYVNEYNKAYLQPEVESKDYEDNFFGWFKDPAWRGAARYATPWLAYGIPLSAIGSMMGTNALWAPTLLGALGAGAYGYGVGSGALKDFSESDFGKMLDTIHTTANKPIGAIWNYLDEGTGRVFNNMTTGPMRYREATPTQQQQPAQAPASTTTYTSKWGPEVFRQGDTPRRVAPEPMQQLNFDSQPEFNTFEPNMRLS